MHPTADPVRTYRKLIARGLILWNARIREGRWPFTYEQAQRLGFSGHVKQRFRGVVPLSDTDLDHLLKRFLTQHQTLASWHQVLLEGSLEEIDWRLGAPRIPLDAVSDWLSLCNDFDPCSLLCLHWAGGRSRQSEPDHEPLPPWRTTPIAEDVELSALWKHGLSDMHVHAGDFVDNLDRYLNLKHRFFSIVRQPAFANMPGLRTFDRRYFGALKVQKSSEGFGHSGYGESMRRVQAPLANACMYMLESPTLERLELRIAPFPRAPDYLRFFHGWRRLHAEIQASLDLKDTPARRPQIRFAVHFKRSAGKSDGAKPNALKQLAELDRQTAALRIALGYRHDAGDELRASLARIDVAGQERDTACDLYHFHLRLLRGDNEALQALEEDRVPERFAPHVEAWRSLVQRGLHRAGPFEPSLGMTIHAGEDFADALDGLYQIASALDACKLNDGDGIGHGLALVSETVHDGRLRMLEAGASLDSLCWLHDLLAEQDAWLGLDGEKSRLRQQIWRVQREIYHEAHVAVPPSTSTDDLIDVWRRRCRDASRRTATPVQRRLLRSEDQLAVLCAREVATPVGAERHFPAAEARARQLLEERVIRRRVVIELNPSSNLRISGSVRSSMSPTLKLLEASAHGLLTCINTDNPGVFGTCIENEYALMLDAAREIGIGEHRIRDWLERARRTGMELLR